MVWGTGRNQIRNTIRNPKPALVWPNAVPLGWYLYIRLNFVLKLKGKRKPSHIIIPWVHLQFSAELDRTEIFYFWWKFIAQIEGSKIISYFCWTRKPQHTHSPIQYKLKHSGLISRWNASVCKVHRGKLQKKYSHIQTHLGIQYLKGK